VACEYIHTYFICHKLNIIEYKYYVESNGRLPEKLVLIMLVTHYYIYNMSGQVDDDWPTHRRRWVGGLFTHTDELGLVGFADK